MASKLVDAIIAGDVKGVRSFLNKEDTRYVINNLPRVVKSGEKASNAPALVLLVRDGQGSEETKCEIAQMLLNAGARPDLLDSDGCSALGLCSAAVMKVLLSAKPPPDLTLSNFLRLNPLHLHAHNGNAEQCKLLIEAKAEVNTITPSGHTPLTFAVENGNIAAASILAAAGGKGSAAKPALLVLTRHCKADEKTKCELAELLISSGARPDVVYNESGTVLDYASPEVLTVLLSANPKPDVNVKNKHYESALHKHAAKGHAEQCRLLIAANCDVHAVTSKGYTPMFIAVKGGSVGVVKVLAAAGLRDSAEEPFLLVLARDSKADEMAKCEMAQILINAGAKPDAIGIEGESALHVCSGAVMGILLSAKPTPDVNKFSDKRWNFTPLHSHAQKGHPEQCQLLLAAKADVNALSSLGDTPLTVACERGHLTVVSVLAAASPADCDFTAALLVLARDCKADEKTKCESASLLLKKGARPDKCKQNGMSPLHLCSAPVMKVLLAANPSPDLSVTTPEGLTPLHTHASKGNLEQCTMLLEAKADTNAQSADQTTPLMSAAANGHVNVVSTLLAFGADFSLDNDTGETAMIVAGKAEHADRLRIISLLRSPLHLAASAQAASALLDAGAHVNATDESGRTALRIAIENQKTDIAWVLLDSRADVNAAAADGHTPLSAVVRDAHIETAAAVFRALGDDGFQKLRSDAKMLSILSNGLGLQLAVCTGHADLVGILLSSTQITYTTPLCLTTQEHIDLISSFFPGKPLLRITVPPSFHDVIEHRLRTRPDVVWPNALVLPALSSKCKLNLSGNGFRRLPAFSWQLPRLQDLDLSNNQLDRLPEAFANLDNLTSLDLRHNCFTTIPYFLGKLPQLRILLAANNPLIGKQADYLMQEQGGMFGFGAKPGLLLQYLQTCHQQRPTSRVQLLLLGPFASGKTTIERALQRKTQPGAKEHTRHVTLGEWHEKVERKSVGELERMTLTYRELPGQAEFYSTNRFFLGQTHSILLLVFRLPDVTKPATCDAALTDLRRWMTLIDVTARKMQQGIRTAALLVATCLGKLPAEPAAVEKWREDVFLQLKTEFKSANIVDMLAIDPRQSRDQLLPKLLARALELVREETEAVFLEDLHTRWKQSVIESLRSREERWMEQKELEEVVVGHCHIERKYASFAVDELVRMGDVIRVSPTRLVFDPEWLSLVVSAVVSPFDIHFGGLEEASPGVDIAKDAAISNGVVRSSVIVERLAKIGQEQLFEQSGFPSSSKPKLIKPGQSVVLELLQSLFVVLPVSLPGYCVVPARVTACCTHLPCTFECAGVKGPALLAILGKIGVVGAEISPWDLHNRLPPGLLFDVINNVSAKFKADALTSDCVSRQQVFLKLADGGQVLFWTREHLSLTVLLFGSEAQLACFSELVEFVLRTMTQFCGDVNVLPLCTPCLQTPLKSDWPASRPTASEWTTLLRSRVHVVPQTNQHTGGFICPMTAQEYKETLPSFRTPSAVPKLCSAFQGVPIARFTRRLTRDALCPALYQGRMVLAQVFADPKLARNKGPTQLQDEMDWRRALELIRKSAASDVKLLPIVGAVQEGRPLRLYLVFEFASRGRVADHTEDADAKLSDADFKALPAPFVAQDGKLPASFRMWLLNQCVLRCQELRQANIDHAAVSGDSFFVDERWSVFVCPRPRGAYEVATEQAEVNNLLSLAESIAPALTRGLPEGSITTLAQLAELTSAQRTPGSPRAAAAPASPRTPSDDRDQIVPSSLSGEVVFV